jgi:hypothetical protein
MTVNAYIKDATGGGHGACVFEDQSLSTSVTPYPPLGVEKKIIFRQYMTTDGTPTGDNDMQQVGTADSPVDFYITGTSDADRYITSLSFEIADASATLNKFGNITALTNGCQLFYEHPTLGDITIHDQLQSNWDFVRLCLGQPGFGDAANAFKANNVAGTSEGYIPVLDLKTFLPPYGIKLDMGTNQKLVLRVRDDTTGVDAFDCIAYGFDRYE